MTALTASASRLAAQARALGIRRLLALGRQHRLRRRLRLYELCSELLPGRRCLEIGGPTALFRSDALPIYALASSVDNCNFSEQTIWQGRVEDGVQFHYDDAAPPGRQFIAEATELAGIADASYDAVLASHVIEHVANPLRALREWARVLAEDGTLVLVVPHKDTTFDHLRPVTTIGHIVEDFERYVGEDDDAHVAEFVGLFDLSRDPELRTRDELATRTARFVENRCIHHHVFDTLLVVQLLDWAGFTILGVETALPFHIVAVARRPALGHRPRNERFLARDAEWARRSWFATDRRRAD